MSTHGKSCRLLPFAMSDGPGNMAADEALLVAAVAGIASLRLYGWTEPTLSLGYFQAAALRETDPLLAALPFVRRCTGGETLVHHHELTYALALPPGPGLAARSRPWLCRMHGIVSAALAAVDVSVRAARWRGKKSDSATCCVFCIKRQAICCAAERRSPAARSGNSAGRCYSTAPSCWHSRRIRRRYRVWRNWQASTQCVRRNCRRRCSCRVFP